MDVLNTDSWDFSLMTGILSCHPERECLAMYVQLWEAETNLEGAA